MLNRVMRRLPHGCTSPQEAALEAFAYTYWAYYNHLGTHARTSLSQQRAWDHDGVQLTSRVNGGRPGFCVAKWNSPEVKKIVVAIEGMSSLAQLWQAWVGCNAVTAAPLAGNVYHSFKTYGDQIKALLQADDFFNETWNEPSVSITFTGFSMGAAIAEYLAVEFKRAWPSTRVNCIKFASPRVGSNVWQYGNTNPDLYANWYLMDDPISVIPYMTMTQLSLMNLEYTMSNTYYAANRRCNIMDANGDLRNVRQLDGYDGFISAMAQTRRDVNNNNLWWWHEKNRYRVALMGVARNLGRDAEARFRYLEYNDENNFGFAYSPGVGFDESYKTVVDPAPADFVYVDDSVRDDAIVRASVRNRAIQIINPVEPRITTPPALANPAWRPRMTRNFN